MPKVTKRLVTKEKGDRSMLAGGRSVRREHSHTAVRFLLKAFVGRHAQRHLAHLAAEATFVPILQRRRESTSTK